MVLTEDFSRIAVLSEEVSQRLIDKYRLGNLKIPDKWMERGVNEWVRYISQWFQKGFPGKEDLLTEWMLKCISVGNIRPEDISRFFSAAEFYFNHYKSDRFKREVKDFSDDNGRVINPKNLLDFNLHDMEDIKESFEQLEVDPRVNQLSGKLPEGAKIIYNDGIYQIVEVTHYEAACDLARGTKWCTSDEEIAASYLDIEPLYVVFFKGKKIGQIHAGVDVQFMDLRDRSITSISDGLRQALEKSGLLQKLFDSLANNLENDRQLVNDSKMFSTLLGDNPSPQMLDYIASKPAFALLYAYGVLGRKRFVRGEKSIASNPLLSLWYAKYIIGGRWEPGENKILDSSNFKYLGKKYLYFLDEIGKLGEFQRDHGVMSDPVLDH
jgi:hypothetical protein